MNLLSLGGYEVFLILSIVIPFILLPIISLWKIYEKSNQPGWSILIPFYNLWVYLKIIQVPWWWMILLFIPYLNIIINMFGLWLLSERFGKGMGFTLGLIFFPFIFLPILGFGNSKYKQNKILIKEDDKEEDINSQNRLTNMLREE